MSKHFTEIMQNTNQNKW